MMKFDVPRLYKYEENLERESYESAVDAIQKFFATDDIDELTDEQKVAVQTYVNDMNSYSLMYGGFREVLNNWGIE
jgi:hypothetical protein